MSDHLRLARHYFIDELTPHFEWTVAGRDLCWCNGTTIAFHAEIVEVIGRLSDETLPDFSTLAFCMATLRASWPEMAQRISAFVALLRLSPEPTVRSAMIDRQRLLESWPSAMRRLALLTQFVENYEPSLHQKAELLEILSRGFNSRNSSGRQANLREALEAGLPHDWPTTQAKIEPELLMPMSMLDCQNALDQRSDSGRILTVLLRLLRIARNVAAAVPAETVEGLAQVLRLGIPDEIQAPKEILQDQRGAARSLLDELSKDDTLSGLSRLTQQLVAAVTLPRALSQPDSLELGGVSDITNRGDLDKLLLSELAYEDETLAVRLALNEALYLRKESPPSAEQRTRSVLIDGSLPMWGIPRLYATAAALALHMTSDRQVNLRCFRSTPTGVEHADLTSRHGLETQLASLQPTAHPGSSLEEFFGHVRENSPVAEPVIITTTDVLDCELFRRSLDSAWLQDVWVIVVERSGRLRILQKTRQGISVRKQLLLPLEEILNPRVAASLRQSSDDRPAIECLSAFPLYLSHHVRAGRAWEWSGGVISVADDGRVLHWTQKNLGGQQLLKGSPEAMTSIRPVQNTGDELWLLFHTLTKQRSWLVCFSPEGKLLREVWLSAGFLTIGTLWRQDEVLLVFGLLEQSESQGESHTEYGVAFDVNSGEVLSKIRMASLLTSSCGRCGFSPAMGHGLLCWTGGNSAWTLQRLPGNLQEYRQVFETGPGRYLAIDSRGCLVDPTDPTRLEVLCGHPKLRGSDVSIRDCSADGNLVLVMGLPGSPDRSAEPFRTVVDVRRAVIVPGTTLEAVEFERAFRKIRVTTPHYRFSKIAADNHRFLLRGPTGALFEIVLDSSAAIVLRAIKQPIQTSLEMMEFAEMSALPGVRYTLQKAEWPNGSCAWLDSRGLLHLRSANRGHPEMTLVMRDGALSGWLSFGAVFGNNYYCGKASAARGLKQIFPKEAWDCALKPFLDSLSWNFLFSSDTTQAGNTVLPGY